MGWAGVRRLGHPPQTVCGAAVMRANSSTIKFFLATVPFKNSLCLSHGIKVERRRQIGDFAYTAKRAIAALESRPDSPVPRARRFGNR
jgi:hypothetical protein